MSGMRLGKAFIKFNGELLETLPGASIDIGGVERKVIKGNNSIHGYSEEPKESMIECEVSVGPSTSLTKLGAITGATITFEADTGQTWVVRNAFNTVTPKATDGDGGKVPVKFAGDPAEEM
ncbi:MAG: phage tail tube protein [Hylemonella sp.]|nr:phage tail tube protein [Hylemonella sp.]MDP1938085.1 phage tail tube protein [Hylemonella sp.]